MNGHPVPGFARRLVGLVTPDDTRQDVLDDLAEEYARQGVSVGWGAARRWYWRQALAAVLPGLRRRLTSPLSPLPSPSQSRSWCSGLLSDATYALRRVTGVPLVAIVTIVSLAIGIGATTAVFAVSQGLVTTSTTAIGDPDGVMSIYTVTEDDPVFGQTSIPDFLALEQDATSLDRVAAFRLGAVGFSATTAPSQVTERPVIVESVTADFFAVLQARLTQGRWVTPEESLLGSARHVAVLSYDFWQSAFNGEDVLGHQIRLDGQVFTVIGIGPQGLRGRIADMRIAAWVPVGLPGGFYHADDEEVRDRADREYSILARAAPGTSAEQVAAELSTLATRLHAEHAASWEDSTGHPLSFRVVAANPGGLPPEFRSALLAAAALVLAGAVLILLIACANVAGLLLAHAHERRQEIAVRAALGASRWRLVRLHFLESLVLGLAGGALGVLGARAAVTLLGTVTLPIGVPLEFDFGLDVRAVAFAFAVSLLACVAFGLLPALAGSQVDLLSSLKVGRLGKSGRHVRLRRCLVVAQVASSLMLLTGAGLVMGSATRTLDSDLGFSTDRIAIASKSVSTRSGSPQEALIEFEALAARLQSRPEVEAVALATSVERVLDDLITADVDAPANGTGRPAPLTVTMNAVSPEYLSLLGMKVTRGRGLTADDRLGTPRVVIVNDALADRLWPDADPVGQRLEMTGHTAGGRQVQDADQSLLVVGVIRDPEQSRTVAPSEIGAGALVARRPRIWVPLSQQPDTRVVFHLKWRGDVQQALAALRADVVGTDTPLVAPQTLDQLMAFPMAVPKAVAQAMRWAGAFALALSFLGIYGIVAFTVTERSREMAIRKAIGARTDQVVGHVMRVGLSLAAWGIGVGLAVTIPMSFLLRGTVEGIDPLDPTALSLGVGVVLCATLVASAIPARRLVSVDPMQVLRDE